MDAGNTARLLCLGAALYCSANVPRAHGQNLLTPPPRTTPAPAGGEAASTRPSLLAPPTTTSAFGRPAAPAATVPAASPSAAFIAPAPAPIANALPASAATNAATVRESAPSAATALRINKGTGVLPNDAGQVWREYDISPYTSRQADVERPEQGVIDWILRETGTAAWFGEPLGVLSAGPTTLRVYHTPEVQQKVQAIVERLVVGGAEEHVLTVRLVSVGSPNWRSRAVSLVEPVDVKSPGVEAWLLSRENGKLLFDQLQQRGDFREHSAPLVQVASGQTQKLARRNPRQYSRGVQMKKEFPFYDLIPGSVDEGYALEISPLMSLDGKTAEAAVDCEIDQIEKLLPVAIDLPIGGQSQRVQIQVPQVVTWRLSERIRWPADQVLLLSCGVVANPAGAAGGPLAPLLGPINGATNRADALLFVEYRGTKREVEAMGGPATPTAQPTSALRSLRNLWRY
jgi:hypothetical protein